MNKKRLDSLNESFIARTKRLAGIISENDMTNEISPELFKNAINVSKERGMDKRTRDLGSNFFRKFVGMEMMGGHISKIVVQAPQHAKYRDVVIEIHRFDDKNHPIKDYIRYDIDADKYDLKDDVEINRKDAVILSKIAFLINPETKYKNISSAFRIKGCELFMNN